MRTVQYHVGAIVQAPSPSAFTVLADAAVTVRGDGRIATVTPRAAASAQGVDEVVDKRDHVLTPAFTDAHVHLPQLDIRGRGSADLLSWLRDTVFPEETRFLNDAHARYAARRFYRALAHHGTLAAGVYLPGAEDAARVCFEEGGRSPLWLVMGNVLMDRNGPKRLLTDDVVDTMAASARLADAFHGKGRLRYAVTPRFAPATSGRLLANAGRFARERGLIVQTHLSETPDEIAWVRRLFPKAPDYLSVYEGAGLGGPRTVFGHAVHATRDEWRRIVTSGACVAHCPLSNEALGSGRFPLERVPANANLALASDVGAAGSLSLVDAMALARRVHPVGVTSGPRLLHLATVAGARALGLADRFGPVAPGFDGSFLLWRAKHVPHDAATATAWFDALLARTHHARPEAVRPEAVVAHGAVVA